MTDKIEVNDIYVPKGSAYPDGAILISATVSGGVSFHPIRGGWLRTLPVNEFQKHYRLTTEQEREQPAWREGAFEIDDYFEPPVRGYTQGFAWNGWAAPSFEYNEAKRIADQFGDITYDEAQDAWILDDMDGEEPVLFTGSDIVVNGETKRVYAIGAGFWTWSEA